MHTNKMNIIKKYCDNINTNVVLVVFKKKGGGGLTQHLIFNKEKKKQPRLSYNLICMISSYKKSECMCVCWGDSGGVGVDSRIYDQQCEHIYKNVCSILS